jgi:hypothetical protein
MSTHSSQPTEGQGVTPATALSAPSHHGSSKMLESYLGDVEYLLREGLWSEAEPLALALPHICAALSHVDLGSSRDRFLEWCDAWVRPSKADTSMTVPKAADLYRLAVEHGADVDGSAESAPVVPLRPLRQLRLRRLSRAAPARRRGALSELRELHCEPAREACVALLEAVRRWYSDWAARDGTVQLNLARLAVLR